MISTTLGAAIILGTGVAITAVNMAISRRTIQDVTDHYEAMLETRKNEIIDLSRTNQKLCNHCATLEAQLAGIRHRVNTPQAEFFDVPKAKAESRRKAAM